AAGPAADREGLLAPAGGGDRLAGLRGVLEAPGAGAPVILNWIWELAPALGPALAADVDKVVAPGAPVVRDLFGIQSCDSSGPSPAPWLGRSRFGPAAAGPTRPGIHLLGAARIWLAEGVRLEPGSVLDATAGPVVLDRSVRVMPHAFLEGPLYVGPGSVVKAGARLGPETSVGAVCKVAGEVAESLLCDFSNKQHDGFLGHAVLGSWTNLGAGTTCSDLKNNYGPVRVDLGGGPRDTGQRFVGLLMGEHSKSAIGTLFNTGSCVGFSCNVFGTGFPPQLLPSFAWGSGPEPYAVEQAIATARVVMGRRGCRFTAAHENLFRALAGA
ncbi:MAG: hypothetical protein ABIJ48_03180, partial [Actinomycetota bacterium]